MPRNASQVYSVPAGTDGTSLTTIFSGKYNTYIHDVETDLNTPRPVVAGGTGATSADGALVNLSGEKAAQVVTNWDSTVWMPGSFFAATTASGAAPVAGHAFSGVVVLNEPLVSPPTNQNVVVEARDMTDPAHLTYYRIMTAGVWGAWLTARQSIYAAPFDALAYNGLQINGSMEVSQELGNVGSGTSGAYACDGWRLVYTSAPLALFAQIGNLGFPGFPSGLLYTVGTAKAALAAGDAAYFQHVIEGYRVSRLAWGTANAQPVTIAFWASHNRAGTYTVSVRNGAATRSYAATYTYTAGPEYHTITVPGCVDGVWETGNLTSIILSFTWACGATLTAPAANSWQNGNYVAAPGQVNAVAATSDAARIVGVVVLPGIEAPTAARSAFIMRPYDQELVICKRYWEYGRSSWNGYATSGILFATVNYFKQTKRSAPTVVQVNAVNTSFPVTTNIDNSAPGPLLGFKSYRFANATGTGEFTEDWTADARI